MSWQAYKLIYMAKSPLYIGYSTLGFVQRTRYYIPGRVLWGAVTANLTRAYGFFDKYIEIGEKISENMRFSYFYPAIEEDNPLRPRFMSNGLIFGKKKGKTNSQTFSLEEFESLFIRSTGQTAIDASSNTAEDESLHDTEFICPKVNLREGKVEDVLWIGYIFIKRGSIIAEISDVTFDKIRPAIQNLFVGGERKYGFGSLSLPSDFEPANERARMFGDGLDLDGEEIILTINKNKQIPAHLCFNERSLDLKGDIEAMLGRDRINENHLVKLDRTEGESPLYWVPGSTVTKKVTLKIGSFGLLSRVIEETVPPC